MKKKKLKKILKFLLKHLDQIASYSAEETPFEISIRVSFDNDIFNLKKSKKCR